MDKFTVTIGGKEIPLHYTMRELADMEEAIGTMDGFKELILQGRQRIRNMAAAIRIMGNAGMKQANRLGDLTDDERQIILDGCLINYNRVK